MQGLTGEESSNYFPFLSLSFRKLNKMKRNWFYGSIKIHCSSAHLCFSESPSHKRWHHFKFRFNSWKRLSWLYLPMLNTVSPKKISKQMCLSCDVRLSISSVTWIIVVDSLYWQVFEQLLVRCSFYWFFFLTCISWLKYLSAAQSININWEVRAPWHTAVESKAPPLMLMYIRSNKISGTKTRMQAGSDWCLSNLSRNLKNSHKFL